MYHNNCLTKERGSELLHKLPSFINIEVTIQVIEEWEDIINSIYSFIFYLHFRVWFFVDKRTVNFREDAAGEVCRWWHFIACCKEYCTSPKLTFSQCSYKKMQQQLMISTYIWYVYFLQSVLYSRLWQDVQMPSCKTLMRPSLVIWI